MRPVESVDVLSPVGNAVHVCVVLAHVVVVVDPDGMAARVVADHLEASIDSQQVRILFQQLVGHHNSAVSVNVVVKNPHRFSEDAPERSVLLPVGDSEVDGVWIRPTPVDPVEGGDGVVAAIHVGQRLHPDGIRVRVDSAVLDHQVDTDQIRHQSTVE